MNVTEIVPGLWRWTAPHPDWKAGDDWEREVGCVYYEAPGGVEPFVVAEVDETLWWLPEHATLVAGDVLVGADRGIEVCPDSWLDERSSHTSIRAALAPLLELPLERVLVSHGEPVLTDGAAALARALG